MFRRTGSFQLGSNLQVGRDDTVTLQMQQRLVQQFFDVFLQWTVPVSQRPTALMPAAGDGAQSGYCKRLGAEMVSPGTPGSH